MALGDDFGQLYNRLAPHAAQSFSGVDPDWTTLAMQMGYIPNPFPAMGTEGQDEMRFLGTLKNIMDQQMGGPGGRAMQMSPQNPTAALPYNLRQYMGALAPLYTSMQGRMLMPGSQASMFDTGYQFGPVAGDQSALQQLLQSARSGAPPIGTPFGPEAIAGANQAALPAPESIASALGASEESVTNPPGTAELVEGPRGENPAIAASGNSPTIREALEQDATSSGAQKGNIPSAGASDPFTRRAWSLFEQWMANNTAEYNRNQENLNKSLGTANKDREEAVLGFLKDRLGL